MKVIIQRVKSASVSINHKIHAQINFGFLIYLGIKVGDKEENIDYLVQKIINLRIFPDQNDKMNLSIKDINGEILLISQFTLYANCQKGNRPSFTEAEKPEIAENLYHIFTEKLKLNNIIVKSGIFGAMMDISLINNGPVTIELEK